MMHLEIALVGQPNCGKSTLFNALAGFKVATGNFQGTTVGWTSSEVAIAGRSVTLFDLPGTYSLWPTDAAERVTRDRLFSGGLDAVVVVLDASVLSRSLELALEVLELGRPMVVVLNMMDDAGRKGVEIDPAALAARLGVAVVPAVATRGTGVAAVALAALRAALDGTRGVPPTYDRDVEAVLADLVARVPPGLAAAIGAPPRFVAARLLEGDPDVVSAAAAAEPGLADRAARHRRELAEVHGWPEDTVFASHRHAAAVDLFEQVARVVPRRRRSLTDRLDDVVMHPVAGLLLAAVAFASIFGVAALVGDLVGGLTAAPFEALSKTLAPLAADSLAWAALAGLVDGVAGGAGIVLPYLLPLLLVMSLYEDVGYLPRAAFLLDGLLHRVGLHGKSVVPLLLGYGCNVPALMGARILETPRDRLATALLVPLVPCSARTVVVLALAAGVLGPAWAASLYVANALVTALVGRALAWILPGRGAGLLMDVPPYRLPPAGPLLRKVGFRIREFVLAAWPVLIVASVALAVLDRLGAGAFLNAALRPLTVGVLGLPEAVGVTLVFGVLRKELTLVLLVQALGTPDLASALTPVQVLTLCTFVVFYVPCVATIATLVRELGWRWAGVSVALNTAIAIAAGAAVRLAG